jgi:Spy/CpxP family protein refolding chaperone
MKMRTIQPTLLWMAVAALGGSIALAQQPTAPANQPPAPAAASNAAPDGAAAPIERQPPSDAYAHPGPGAAQARRQGLQSAHRLDRAGVADKSREGFRGDEAERFRAAHEGGFEEGLHIGPEGLWWRNPQIAQKIALTPDQIKRMDDILQKSRIELIDLKANLEKQNAFLEPLLSANPVDSAKALAQIDKIAQARADLEKAHARLLLGIRGVLTPEQWTKLNAHRGSGGAGFVGPGGPGAPGGNGAGGHGGGFGPGHSPNNVVQPDPMQ